MEVPDPYDDIYHLIDEIQGISTKNRFDLCLAVNKIRLHHFKQEVSRSVEHREKLEQEYKKNRQQKEQQGADWKTFCQEQETEFENYRSAIFAKTPRGKQPPTIPKLSLE